MTFWDEFLEEEQELKKKPEKKIQSKKSEKAMKIIPNQKQKLVISDDYIKVDRNLTKNQAIKNIIEMLQENNNLIPKENIRGLNNSLSALIMFRQKKKH